MSSPAVVACEQHGPMTWDERLEWWVCSGFAGEGCLTGMIITARQAERAARGIIAVPGVSVMQSEAG